VSITLAPAVQPTNVGTGGVIVQVPIPKSYQDRSIALIRVVKKSGSSATHSVDAYTEATCSVPEKKVGSIATGASPREVTGPLYWDAADGSVWVKVVPNTGSDNAFDVRVFLT